MDARKYARKLRRLVTRQTSGEGQLPAGLERDLRLIFNKEFYVEDNPDVAEEGADPWAHYLNFGMKEDRQPSPLFSPSYYQDEVPGLTEPAIQHFLLRGGLEGHNPIPMGFDCTWYMSQHPEVARSRTNPLVHYLRKGRGLGYDPSPIFSVSWYRKQNPDVAHSRMEPLTHYLWKGFDEGRTPSASGPRWAPEVETASQVVEESKNWLPFATRPVPAQDRITLVTDAIDASHLIGTVATSIIVAALWTNQTGRTLRVLTRTSAFEPSSIRAILAQEGISLAGPLELVRVPIRADSDDLLPVSDTDVFLTTSWSATQAALASIQPRKIVYLLHEDERAFYPVGSNWLHANTMMDCPDISVLVNSESLLRHLIDTGVGNLAQTGHVFTPSFSRCSRPGRRLDLRDNPMRICFYARPQNPRTLFSYGVAAIDEAIGRGIITDEMEVVFLGDNVQPIRFVDRSVPKVAENLSWEDHQEFMSSVDIGISLMASPCVGNTTWEMASNGAVVVTNLWPGKPVLSHTLSRVVEVSPDVSSLVDGIARAIRVVREVESQPFEPERIDVYRTWQENLADPIRWAQERVTRV